MYLPVVHELLGTSASDTKYWFHAKTGDTFEFDVINSFTSAEVSTVGVGQATIKACLFGVRDNTHYNCELYIFGLFSLASTFNSFIKDQSDMVGDKWVTHVFHTEEDDQFAKKAYVLSKRNVCPIFELKTDWSSSFIYAALREASKIIKTHHDNYFAFHDNVGRNNRVYYLNNPNQILVELTWQSTNRTQQINITMSNRSNGVPFYNKWMDPHNDAICSLGLMFLEKMLEEEKSSIPMDEAYSRKLAPYVSSITKALSPSRYCPELIRILIKMIQKRNYSIDELIRVLNTEVRFRYCSHFSDISVITYNTCWKYTGFEKFTNTYCNYTDLVQNNTYRTYHVATEASPPHFGFRTDDGLHVYNVDESKPVKYGSFGKVFECYCGTDNQKVVIKMIDNVPAEKLSLILESTEYARNVQHTNIAQVYNIYSYSSKFRNVLYVVMKLYPHGDLEDFIQVHSPLCQTTILHFLHEIIRGMKYLHARPTPFLHRDISTDNIFLSESNSTFQNLVIGDFDLGREIVSGADTKVGKDMYAPPEMNQLERTYGVKADVWSLGVVALQLMSGGKFAKKTGMNRPLAIEMVYNTEATVKKIRDLLSVDFDSDVTDAVLQMVSCEPHDRPSMEGLQAMLRCPMSKNIYYIGSWNLENEMHGEGTFVNTTTHETFQGTWRHGKPHKGTMRYDNGEIFEGTLVDYKRSGVGTYYYANGDQYTGSWLGNARHGNGTFKAVTGLTIHEVYEHGVRTNVTGVEDQMDVNVALTRSEYDLFDEHPDEPDPKRFKYG